MVVPKGFEDLVAAAAKERPSTPKTFEEIWEKFLYAAFMGGKRSEADIQSIINMLKGKKLLDFDYVLKTDGEDWREAVENLLKERIPRIRDEDSMTIFKELQKELFRVTASIKGTARFLKAMTPEKLAESLNTKEKTWTFIENLANNEDVPNIKYTKIIVWLHSIGFAFDFCPPSWQTKKFLNSEIGPYYQFYEDDAYFMNWANRFSDEVTKRVKGTKARDVSVAIYYYMVPKNILPPRSPIKKKCTPQMILQFLKKKKLTLRDLSAAFGDFEKKEEVLEAFYRFVTQ